MFVIRTRTSRAKVHARKHTHMPCAHDSAHVCKELMMIQLVESLRETIAPHMNASHVGVYVGMFVFGSAHLIS